MLIFGGLLILAVVLVGLNAATYVQKEKVPDTEFAPNRSSYNSGSTGTQAFYALLSETGHKVRRWQAELDTINLDTADRPSVFVMIGPFRRQLSDVENTQLMAWVAAGGTLVLIDRDPLSELAVSTAQWKLSVTPTLSPEILEADASNQSQMTADTPAVKPSLPSYVSGGINSIQPSRFASSISLERLEDREETRRITDTVSGISNRPPPPPGRYDPSETERGAASDDTDADTEVIEDLLGEDEEKNGPSFDAPVVHIGGQGRNLLVEAPFAAGRIMILSDPYIVSNAGIAVADNSRLAVNLVTSRAGPIAFDEYHHGHGANNNRLFQYFEGTPVALIFLQFGLIVALVFFSQSRRFARPVPEPEPDRLSKLEYVSAMAELQQRTHAYDLAVENIYSDFRRRACSLVGLDNTTAKREELAGRIAERIGMDPVKMNDLLFRCEDIMYGSSAKPKQTVELVDELRAVEEKLGLRRAGRKGV